MRKISFIFVSVFLLFLLAACQTNSASVIRIDDKAFSLEYDPAIWEESEEANDVLSLIDDPSCSVDLDAGGKGLMGAEISSERNEDDWFEYTSNATGKLISLEKTFDTGTLQEGYFVVKITLSLSDNPDYCKEQALALF